MDSFQLREPVSALSHGLGMILALLATTALMVQLRTQRHGRPRYHLGKAFTLLVFGLCLTFCYGASCLFHALPIPPGSDNVFHRLDHVGIYLLIAGSYTPVAWSMMGGRWRGGTLAAVWTFAVICATRVWLGGLLPIWMSTFIYLSMGWAALGCYRDLMRRHPQRVLYPLPLGGLFYSIGAVINLSKWPVLVPGVVAAHEVFHLFVLAGSAWHVSFMLRVVVPAVEPSPSESQGGSETSGIPVPKFLMRRRAKISRARS
jgi:hemolysin III